VLGGGLAGDEKRRGRHGRRDEDRSGVSEPSRHGVAGELTRGPLAHKLAPELLPSRLMRRALRAYAAIAIAVATTGCSYDWALSASSGSDAGDAGPSTDATVPDASDASVPDAAEDVGTVDAPPPPDDGAPSCADLLTAIGAAELAAKTGCTVGVPCTATINDQCGCKFFLAEQSSTATGQLENALGAYESAACSGPCPTCPTPPSSVACLESGTSDGGFTSTCIEP
jgi:hypothetical protein